MATMHVDLVAPDRAVWSGEAETVIAKTVEGDIGIKAGHQPLLGALVESPVRIIQEGGEDLRAAVHGGFITVNSRGVTILAEVVELADDIDAGRARQALDRARGAADDDEDAKASGRRAAARLRAVGENV